MMKILEEIQALSGKNVYIKNKEALNKTLMNLTEGGLEKLQVLSDFDKTITKHHHNGVPHKSSFAIFSSIPSSMNNKEYQTIVQGLRKKYYPIELDPHLTVEEKIKHMEEWWSLSEKAIKGLKVTQEEIEEACKASEPVLRDGCKDFFKSLNESNVPVLVFSAGCGDIVLTILKQCGVYLPNVKVISNFLKYSEDGTILGFQDKLIHVFNKNEYALKNTDFFHVVSDRDNAIVMGDSLGDANMAQGMEHCRNVLKIGLLYDHVEDSLPQYMDTFDIVLVDDQTMNVPKAILDYIQEKTGSKP
ncbi:cytosolic 5'-nucleotidase 3 [Anthonomus grandis grandis]|uniref:cytosolic 5'-nucleotidase 3 n=1 Tax=Anthonomus grandis grandis TaxID=2921223 RepID=UPI002166590C|nr:cytosolic 5'-nucleotidase 3 [Anthonomus grandis grandis]